MNPYYQPRNFRYELSEPEGCAPRKSLKPEMNYGLGIDASVSSGAATGAVGNKTGPNFILGGSNGFSTTTMILLLAAAVAGGQ